MNTKKQSPTRKTLALYWRFTREDKFLFWYGTIGAVFGILLTDIIPPFIIAQAFNRIQTLVSSNQPLIFGELAHFVWLYIGVVICGIIVWRTEAWAVWSYDIRTKKRIYEYIFNHLQNMDSRFHANRFGGALVSQTNKFVGAYDRFVADFTWNIVTGITATFFSITVLTLTNWRYGLVLFVFMLAYFLVILGRMRKQAPHNREVSAKESLQTAKLADNITNVSAVRTFAAEDYELKLYKKQTGVTYMAENRLKNIQMFNELINQLGTSSINVLAFGLGIVSITYFDASVGALYLILSYTVALTRRLWDSMFILKSLNRGFGDAAEMTEILHLAPHIKDDPAATAAVVNRGDIEFKDVVFRHEEQTRPLFDGLNVHIKPGEKVGLVGHSGSGKTSLVNLLLRFSDINGGSILIDGQDISKVTLKSLRSAITFVPQEPLLFHRTLAENIAYSDPDASPQQIEAIAKLANAHEFINGLPKGYQTLVGERGVKLSGGQRQRVAIARAMLKNAPILVLDEATSALDSVSESLIQDALWKLMEGKTSIVIAHRLSTIQKMDRILVIEDGKVIEQGSHTELLRQAGTYANLWSHQSGGFLDD